MWSDFGDREQFGETLRSIARELGDSIERLAGEVDVEEAAGYAGVDPDRAREWLQSTANWLGSQLDNLGEEVASRASAAKREPEGRPAGEDPLSGAAPHPLDIPTEEQGVALAALESGRWTIEPGTERLVGEGERRDSIGLVGELRARDWITADGHLTLAGRRALGRWLDAAAR
jgi:ParB-like chromosome segregation protein Spo0J